MGRFFRRKFLLGLGMIWQSVTNSFISVSQGFTHVLVNRTLAGIGSSPQHPKRALGEIQKETKRPREKFQHQTRYRHMHIFMQNSTRKPGKPMELYREPENPEQEMRPSSEPAERTDIVHSFSRLLLALPLIPTPESMSDSTRQHA
jgi:hypothetical protein